MDQSAPAERRDAPPWMSTRACARTAEVIDRLAGVDTVAEGLRVLADGGLLDEGVDPLLADYAEFSEPPAPSETAWGRLAALVGELADRSPELARAVVGQRLAIEALARGRRTPINERLLRTLRRGRLTGALGAAAPGSRVVADIEDCSTLAVTGRVRVWGDLPVGAAVLVPVEDGTGCRLLGWFGTEDVGVTRLPGRSGGGDAPREYALAGVRVCRDELVSTHADSVLRSLAPARARLDAALTGGDPALVPA